MTVLRTYGTLTSYIYILHDEICDKCKHISFCISHHVLATSRLEAMILYGLYIEDVYQLTWFFQYSSQRTMERWEVLKYDLFPLIFKQRWIVDIGNRDIPRQKHPSTTIFIFVIKRKTYSWNFNPSYKDVHLYIQHGNWCQWTFHYFLYEVSWHNYIPVDF